MTSIIIAAILGVVLGFLLAVLLLSQLFGGPVRVSINRDYPDPDEPGGG